MLLVSVGFSWMLLRGRAQVSGASWSQFQSRHFFLFRKPMFVTTGWAPMCESVEKISSADEHLFIVSSLILCCCQLFNLHWKKQLIAAAPFLQTSLISYFHLGSATLFLISLFLLNILKWATWVVAGGYRETLSRSSVWACYWWVACSLCKGNSYQLMFFLKHAVQM